MSCALDEAWHMAPPRHAWVLALGILAIQGLVVLKLIDQIYWGSGREPAQSHVLKCPFAQLNEQCLCWGNGTWHLLVQALVLAIGILGIQGLALSWTWLLGLVRQRERASSLTDLHLTHCSTQWSMPFLMPGTWHLLGIVCSVITCKYSNCMDWDVFCLLCAL